MLFGREGKFSGNWKEEILLPVLSCVTMNVGSEIQKLTKTGKVGQ